MKKHIHESNLIEWIDDTKEDEQSLVAWKWLKKQEKLSHSVVCHLHKLITLNQLVGYFKGYYRDISQSNVQVGGRVAPHYSELGSLMFNWIEDIADHTPIENHIAFEHIHPFVDGNGRTGRMLMWWQELKNGQEPTLFLNSEKQEYYKLFRSK